MSDDDSTRSITFGHLFLAARNNSDLIALNEMALRVCLDREDYANAAHHRDALVKLRKFHANTTIAEMASKLDRKP